MLNGAADILALREEEEEQNKVVNLPVEEPKDGAADILNMRNEIRDNNLQMQEDLISMNLQDQPDNLDLESEIYQLSEKTGWHPDDVRNNLKAIRTQSEILDLDIPEYLSKYPATAKLLQDRKKTAIAADDIKNLSYAERLVGSSKNRVDMMEVSFQMADVALKIFNGDASAENIALLEELEAKQKELGQTDYGLNWLSETLPITAEQGYLMGQILNRSQDEIASGTAIGAAVGAPTGLGAAPAAWVGAGIGWRVGSIKEIGQLEGMLAYIDYRKMTDSYGRAIDENAAKGAAVLVGVVNGALETAGIETIGRTFPPAKIFIDGLVEAIRVGGRTGLKKALGVPVFRDLLIEIGKRFSAAVFTNTLQEGAQEAMVGIGADIAGMTGSEYTVPTETWGERASGILEAMSTGLRGAAGLSLPGSAVAVVQAKRRVMAAESRADQIAEMAGVSAESKLRQRDPQAFKDHIKEASEQDGSPKEVYVAPDKIEKFFQSGEVSPVDQEIAFPGLQERLSIAKELGEDVAIPLDEFMTYVAPSDNFIDIAQDFKLDRMDLTAREAEEMRASIADLEEQYQAMAAREDTIAEVETDRRVFEDVRMQLESQGESPQAAAQQAEVLNARFVVAAKMFQESGQEIDAYDLYKQGNLSVQREGMEGPMSRGQTQEEGLINLLRVGGVSEQEMFGQSLTEFVRSQGGIVDQGGELSAMDAGGRGGIIRKGGKRISDLIETARDAGYPEMTENEFIEAIRSEQAGEMTYSAEQQNQEKIDLNYELQRFKEYLENEGIDLDTATNEQALEQLTVYNQKAYQTAAERDYGFKLGNLDDLPEDVRNVVEAQIDGTTHPDKLRENLDKLAETSWAGAAIEGMLTRAAMLELIAGREPTFPSKFVKPAAQKLKAAILKGGMEAIKLEFMKNPLSTPLKPDWAINSQFAECEPSLECAKYCYATDSGYPMVMIKAEMMGILIEQEPVWMAEQAAAAWKATPEWQIANARGHNIALRMFERGDGNENWLPFMEEMKKQNVRLHVFSKRPDFLRKVPSFHLRLLSGDKSNQALLEENLDLPIAYVYDGTQAEADWINAHQKSVQMVLPIRIGQRFLTEEEIALIEKDPDKPKKICPVDAGYVSLKPMFDIVDKDGNILGRWKDKAVAEKKAKKIGPDLVVQQPVVDNWRCSRCDIGGGTGCYICDTSDKAFEEANDASHEQVAEQTEEEIINAFKRLTDGLDPELQQRLLGNVDDLIQEVRATAVNPRKKPTPGQLDGTAEDDGPGGPGTTEDGGVTRLNQAAYHGTPYLVDQFSTDYIGTGEGAAAYGWGLYFAGKKEIAAYYRDALTPRDYQYEAELKRRYKEAEAQGDYFKMELYELAMQHETPQEIRDRYDDTDYDEETRERANEIVDEIAEIPADRGNLYKVDIPEDGEYLLWDVPLSEQSEKVKKALENVNVAAKKVADMTREELIDVLQNIDPNGVWTDEDNIGEYGEPATREDLLWNAENMEVDQYLAESMFDDPHATGQSLYRQITAKYGGGNTWSNDAQRKASEHLLSLGIRGIKYLDGSSRADNVVNKTLMGIYNKTGDAETAVDEFMRTIHESPKEKEKMRNLFLKKLNSINYNYVIFSGDDVEILEQYDQASRGHITFPEGREWFTITLTGKADKTTFLHETGHFLLEMQDKMSALPNAPQTIIDETARIRKWLGAAPGEKLTREQHEQFAEAFEKYLMEGKAPSNALRGAFQRFKLWFKSVYANLRQLNVELDPEIRDIFDRMLATDEELNNRINEAELLPLFATADEMGVSREAFEYYLEKWDEAKFQAADDLDRKVLDEYRREQSKVYKARQKAMRERVEAEAAQRKDFNTWSYITKGKTLDGSEIDDGVKGVKLSFSDVKEAYPGTDNARLLSSRRVAKKGGMPASQMAPYFGYATGEELMNDLIQMPSYREWVKFETDRRMNEEYGDILNDGTLEEEAIKAINNDKTAYALMLELVTLNRLAGLVDPKLMAGAGEKSHLLAMRLMREHAQQLIGSRKFTQLSPHQHRQNEIKWAKQGAAEQALGQLDAAAQSKRKQILNHYLYVESQKAKDQVDKIRNKWARYSNAKFQQKIGKVGGDYLEQIQQLLENIDLRKSVSGKLIQRRKSLAAWIKEQEDAGEIVNIPEKIRDASQLISYKDMTYADLLEIDDAIDTIVHLANTKGTLQLRKERQDFEDVMGEILFNADSNLAERKGRKYANKKTLMERARDRVEGLAAELVKLESVATWIDGGKPGFAHSVLYRPFVDALREEYDIKKRMGMKIHDLMKAIPAKQIKRLNKKHVLPGGVKVDGIDVLSVALNWGNMSNRNKMIKGYEERGWTHENIQAFLDATMAKEDWEFVQGVWDELEEIGKLSLALARRTTGKVPPKIEAVPVFTPHGIYRGGYYPMAYDPDSTSPKAHDVQKHRIESDLFLDNFMRVGVSHGFAEARNEEYAAPLLLSLSVLNRHIDEVVHYLTHYEAVMATNKIFSDRRFQSMIKSKFGSQHNRALKIILKNIASDSDKLGREDVGLIGPLLGHLRGGLTAVTFAYNLSTAMTQTLGLLPGMTKVSPIELSATLLKHMTVKGAVDDWKFANEHSKILKDSVTTWNQNIKQQMDAGMTELGVNMPVMLYRRMMKYGFTFVGGMQREVSGALWMAAYKQHLNEEGHDGAVVMADNAITSTQGGGGGKDLSPVQIGNNFKKPFTSFMGYFLVQSLMLREIYRNQAGKNITGKTKAGMIPETAAKMALIIALPVLVEAWMRGTLPDEDDEESFLKWYAVQNFLLAANLPFFGSIVSQAVEGKYGYSMNPTASMIDRMISKGQRVFNSDVETPERMQSALYVAAPFLKFPSTEVVRLWKVYDKVNEDGELDDYARELIYGVKRD